MNSFNSWRCDQNLLQEQFDKLNQIFPRHEINNRYFSLDKHLVCETRNLLEESTFDLADNVDRVFNKLEIGKYLKDLKADTNKYVAGFHDNGEGIVLSKMTSNFFKGGDCEKAHQIKPLEIWFGGGNYNEIYYNSDSSVIVISLITPSYLYELGRGGDISQFTNRFSVLKFKQFIAHELNHWLQDVFHNNVGMDDEFMNNPNNKTIEFGYISNHELNSYVHEIEEIKNQIGDVNYDKLTWQELLHQLGLNLPPQISQIDVIKFSKKIITRLSRENLIGVIN